jgi:hypothetical protein
MSITASAPATNRRGHNSPVRETRNVCGMNILRYPLIPFVFSVPLWLIAYGRD